MSEQKELQTSLEAIETQIKKLHEQADMIHLRLNELKFGIKLGQEIVYKKQAGIVTRFEYSWPVMYPYLKDGTLSKRLVHCYDYTEENK